MYLTTLSLLTAVLYSLISLFSYLTIFKKLTNSKALWLGMAMLPLSLHGYLLYRWIDTPAGQNLSVSHLFSLICWLNSFLLLLSSLIKPLANLFVFILPLSAVSILLALFFPGLHLFQTREHPITLIHILISITAFGTLSMAALQASLLYWQNRILRNNSTQGIVRLLPPLQTMETFLFQTLWSGFLLLSASLFSALLFLDNRLWLATHLQKIIFSLLAWSAFATLLYGHYQSGLRGLKATQWTLIGMALLIGAYCANLTHGGS